MKEKANGQDLIFHSEYDRSASYYSRAQREFTNEQWGDLCRLKDGNLSLYDKRLQAAKLVIDALARRVGIDPENSGSNLYCPDNMAGDSDILRKLDDYFDRSGDKIKMKKRIDELENENRILRTLIFERAGSPPGGEACNG